MKNSHKRTVQKHKRYCKYNKNNISMLLKFFSEASDKIKLNLLINEAFEKNIQCLVCAKYFTYIHLYYTLEI